MITIEKWNSELNEIEVVKATPNQKVNDVILDKLLQIVEFPWEAIPGYDQMTEKEQERVYNLVCKKVNRFRPKK